MTTVEQRLNQIEATLGFENLARNGSERSSSNSSYNQDVQTRLQSLLDSTSSLLKESPNSALDITLKECDELARDLSPSGLLLKSDAATSSSVGVYRKQEILARFEELESTFELLAKIRDLLMTSNPTFAKDLQARTSKGGSDPISVDHIVSAPILTDSSFTFAADAVNVKRLNTLAADLLDAQERSMSLANRVDAMLDRYYAAMTAVNEKMVLVQEEAAREK